MLFSVKHTLGALLFVILVGSYYYMYSQHNGLDIVFTTLWNESSKRTVTETNLWTSVAHILTFPLQLLFHFLPFTLLVILLFRKKRWKLYYQNSFLQFSFWVVIANLVVYWLSPETRPRYLFMFLPFIFVWMAYAIEEVWKHHNPERRWTENIILILQVILPVLCLVPLFMPKLHVSYLWLKVLGMVALSLFILALSWKYKVRRVLMLICTLLVVRIGFDFFVFPYRAEYGSDAEYKNYGIRAGQLMLGKSLYVAENVHLDHCLSFYISRENKRIVKVLHQDLKPDEYCIVLTSELENLDYSFVRIYDFITIYGRTPLCIIQRTL